MTMPDNPMSYLERLRRLPDSMRFHPFDQAAIEAVRWATEVVEHRQADRQEHEATRRRLKKILGIEGDSGLNNAELAARAEEHFRRQADSYRHLLGMAIDGLEDSDLGAGERDNLVARIREFLRD